MIHRRRIRAFCMLTGMMVFYFTCSSTSDYTADQGNKKALLCCEMSQAETDMAATHSSLPAEVLFEVTGESPDQVRNQHAMAEFEKTVRFPN
jgi:hypothetical protein